MMISGERSDEGRAALLPAHVHPPQVCSLEIMKYILYFPLGEVRDTLPLGVLSILLHFFAISLLTPYNFLFFLSCAVVGENANFVFL